MILVRVTETILNVKHSISISILIVVSSALISFPAGAYPDFIGYGYSSCVTCHYNSLGGGALNDYGRALFATEITARDIFPKDMDEEAIAAQSGFLGTKQLPWWVRPGIKYRGLKYMRGLGSEEKIERFINMQADVNLNFFVDKKQDIALINTASYVDKETYYGKTYEWYMREYYIRWKYNRNLFVYIGQMDKAFGIRQIDHTNYGRGPLKLGMNDQSQGVIAHFVYPDWDIATNIFLGNGLQEEEDKQRGLSVTGEYQIYEKFKVGASALNSESDKEKYNLLAVSTRMGTSKGSAVMAEAGLKEITDKISGAEAKLGTYAYIQTLVNIRRGYNFLSTLEHTRSDISRPSRESMKWAFGALMFPLPRSEFRLMFDNGKAYDDTVGVPDSWAFQGQFHLSY